jgi:hypothetical protein
MYRELLKAVYSQLRIHVWLVVDWLGRVTHLTRHQPCPRNGDLVVERTTFRVAAVRCNTGILNLLFWNHDMLYPVGVCMCMLYPVDTCSKARTENKWTGSVGCR